MQSLKNMLALPICNLKVLVCKLQKQCQLTKFKQNLIASSFHVCNTKFPARFEISWKQIEVGVSSQQQAQSIDKL
jgi:hypothetical protein